MTMNMMNNFDKVKRDALNELDAEQSRILIKQNTLEIMNNIFTERPNQQRLNELSKRQIDLVNFYYEKDYHFEMMHGIISGCYEKACEFYSENVFHKFEMMEFEFISLIQNYLMQFDLLKLAVEMDVPEIADAIIKKMDGKMIHKLNDKLESLLDYMNVENDKDVETLFKQFLDAESYVDSIADKGKKGKGKKK